MLILHDNVLSAECYAVRLTAALLGVDLQLAPLDVWPGRANEDAAFLAINPLGTVPVLEVPGEPPLRDGQAIMAWLALHHDPAGRWWPAGEPRLHEWLGFARDLGASAGGARLHDDIGFPGDIDALRARAHRLLREMERHLWFAERAAGASAWLLPLDHPTVADIACFVHVALSGEGGIAHVDYPAVRRWLDRLRNLPGFVATSGIFAPMGSRR